MKFEQANYSEIKMACKNKKEIEFEAPKEITAFANSEAPENWTLYTPSYLPPEGYADVFIYGGTDAKGALTRFEIIVHLDGGHIFYKRNSNEMVGMKVTWPNNGIKQCTTD